MSWVRIDDVMPEHPKVAGLSDRAFRAHVEAMCYAARSRTRGRLATSVVRRYGWHRSALELVEAGVWEEVGDGWVIHDFETYNPTRDEEAAHEAKVRGGRTRAAQAGRAGGKFTSSSPADHQQSAEPAETSTTSFPSPSRPHPLPQPDPQSEIDPPIAPQHPVALKVYSELASSLGVFSAPIGWAETWLGSRTLEQVIDAIGKAREKGAHSTAYVDAILANPPTARPARKTYAAQFANAAEARPDPFAHLIHRGSEADPVTRLDERHGVA